jgi:two-component system sensor histidine kinase KdpD
MAALLGVLLFDFLFVPPEFSFAVSDAEYLITFVVMLITGLVISHFATRGRRQASVARARERRAAELFALSRELAQTRDASVLGAILCRHVLAGIDGEAVVLLPDAQGHVLDPSLFCTRGKASASVTRYPVPGNDLGIAQWAYDHRQNAGATTDTLASADAIYLPLNALKRCLGVLGLRPSDPTQLHVPEQMQLLESFVSQTAVAMERVQLADTAQAADVEIETEKMRNALLSSISHDFRTPLASIIGATSSLLSDDAKAIPEAQRSALLQTVLDEASRLHRLVDNLLDLTRLSAGTLPLKRQWVALEEIVGAVLNRLRVALEGRQVQVDLPEDLPLVHADEVMLEQLLFNLVDNAQKYTPPASAIRISAQALRGEIVVSVRDHGPGLPPGEEARVFDKFHRGRNEAAQSGFGLGLTICRAIVEAHGGEISARNLADGGAEFRFTLPAEELPPA